MVYSLVCTDVDSRAKSTLLGVELFGFDCPHVHIVHKPHAPTSTSRRPCTCPAMVHIVHAVHVTQAVRLSDDGPHCPHDPQPPGHVSKCPLTRGEGEGRRPGGHGSGGIAQTFLFFAKVLYSAHV